MTASTIDTSTAADMLAAVAEIRGTALALVTDEVRWSYAELAQEVATATQAFSTARIEPGERVLVVAGNDATHITAHFGLLTLGAVVVPIDPMMGTNELESILVQVEPCHAVVASDVVPRATTARLEEAGLDIITVPSDATSTVADAAQTQRRASATDDAVMFFTSGTTGVPKGVIHTHASLLRTLQALEATRSADQHQWLTPLAFHTIGGHAIVYRVLLQGDCLVLMRDFHPRRLLQLVSDEKVSAIGIAPAMVDLLLRVPRPDRFDLSSLEIIGVGSSPLPPSLARAATEAFGATVINTYGSTELGGPVLMAVPDAPDEFVLLSAAEVRIVGADGAECGAEEPGELECRVPTPARYAEDEAGVTVQTERGWYGTGDLAMHIPGGRIRLLGRADDMVSKGGRNVFPVEIENVLTEHESVAAAAVVGVDDSSGSVRLVAFVELTEPSVVVADDLVQWCADRLSAHKVPSVVRVIDSLPRTRNGKVRKIALRPDAARLAGADAQHLGSSISREGRRP